MLACESRRLLPVGTDFLFPLPVLGRSILRRPAVSNPVRIRVIGIAARTSGESDNHFYAQLLRQQHSAPESLRIPLGHRAVAMHRIPITTQAYDLNVAVLELLPPRLQLRRIFQ